MKIPNTTDKRPNLGDEGKRVWVWELPGNNPSQIKTGVLADWDEKDLEMEDGRLYPWLVITDGGFGDPPEATS